MNNFLNNYFFSKRETPKQVKVEVAKRNSEVNGYIFVRNAVMYVLQKDKIKSQNCRNKIFIKNKIETNKIKIEKVK